MAEPHKRERVSARRTAIGLQDVDGLRVSDYLKKIAVKHIEGDITIDEVREQTPIQVPIQPPMQVPKIYNHRQIT